MSKETQNRKPAYYVYAVKKGKERNYWQQIGAAWSYKDGETISLSIDLLPVAGQDVVLRVPNANEDQQEKA